MDAIPTAVSLTTYAGESEEFGFSVGSLPPSRLKLI